MKSKSYNLNTEKLIVLILILSLSTLSLFIRIHFDKINNLVKQVLLYFGFFGLGFVLLAVLFYYISKVSYWLRKDQIRIGVAIIIILALSHALFSGLSSEKFWFTFLSYLAGDGLIIIIGLFAFLKWKNKRRNSNKLK